MINVLQQASDVARRKWNSSGSGWKAAVIVFFVLLTIVGTVGLFVWLSVKMLKGIAVGGGKNYSLYFPQTRRHR